VPESLAELRIEIPTGTIAGTVVAFDGSPVAGAHVWVSHLEDRGLSRSTSSHADGSYRLDALWPGPHEVHAYVHDSPHHARSEPSRAVTGVTDLVLRLR